MLSASDKLFGDSEKRKAINCLNSIDGNKTVLIVLHSDNEEENVSESTEDFKTEIGCRPVVTVVLLVAGC